MDSLDLVAAFLNENGVKAEKIVDLVRVSGYSIIPEKATKVFVYYENRHPEMQHKIMIRCGVTFDLHHPNSLQDMLAHIKGRTLTIKWPRRTTYRWDNG
jgi:hypothetical protein